MTKGLKLHNEQKKIESLFKFKLFNIKYYLWTQIAFVQFKHRVVGVFTINVLFQKVLLDEALFASGKFANVWTQSSVSRHMTF
jgi:hypothetical protein